MSSNKEVLPDDVAALIVCCPDGRRVAFYKRALTSKFELDLSSSVALQWDRSLRVMSVRFLDQYTVFTHGDDSMQRAFEYVVAKLRDHVHASEHKFFGIAATARAQAERPNPSRQTMHSLGLPADLGVGSNSTPIKVT